MHSGLPLGTIKGKSSLGKNGEGVRGWGETCNNKDSYARLSHEPGGGRAAPQAPVTNQWLNGLDNAPWTTLPFPPCICLTTCCNSLREHQRYPRVCNDEIFSIFNMLIGPIRLSFRLVISQLLSRRTDPHTHTCLCRSYSSGQQFNQLSQSDRLDTDPGLVLIK